MRGRHGQSTIELALILCAAIAAFVAMWPLLRDAVEGRLKQTGDAFSQGGQFEGISGVRVTRTQACAAVDPVTKECTSWVP